MTTRTITENNRDTDFTGATYRPGSGFTSGTTAAGAVLAAVVDAADAATAAVIAAVVAVAVVTLGWTERDCCCLQFSDLYCEILCSDCVLWR